MASQRVPAMALRDSAPSEGPVEATGAAEELFTFSTALFSLLDELDEGI